MDAYQEMMTGIDEVKPMQGQTGEPLPTGRYPLRIERIVDRYQSPNGAVLVRCHSQITEGSFEGQNAYYTVILAPSQVDREQRARDEEEMKAIIGRVKGRMKGLITALKVEPGKVDPTGEPLDQLCQFWNIDNWIGCEFMGRLTLTESTQGNKRNELTAFHALDDPKYGIEAWRKSESTTGSTAAAGGVQI